MADDLGFQQLFGLIRAGVMIVAVGVGVVAVGGMLGDYQRGKEAKATAALVERANDTLTRHKLTPVTLEKFKKLDSCDADHPQGASFIARDAGGKLVEGTICSAPNRDNVLTLKP